MVKDSFRSQSNISGFAIWTSFVILSFVRPLDYMFFSLYVFNFCFAFLYFVDIDHHTDCIFINLYLSCYEVNQVNFNFIFNKEIK